jgi:hypothetical protein
MRLDRRYFTGTAVNVPLNALAIPEEGLLAEIRPADRVLSSNFLLL